MTTCPAAANAPPCGLHAAPPSTCQERCATPHLTGDPCPGRCPRCGAACTSWEGHHGDCYALPPETQAAERHRHEAACKHQARWPNPCPPGTAAVLLKARTPGGPATRCQATTLLSNAHGLPSKARCRRRGPHDPHAYWSRSILRLEWRDPSTPPGGQA